MSSTDIPVASEAVEVAELSKPVGSSTSQEESIIVPANVDTKKKTSIGPIDPATGKNMTAKDMAQAVMKAEDKPTSAKVYFDYIVENSSGAVLQSSRLSNIRKTLKELGADTEVIDLFKSPHITTEANAKNSNKSTTRLVQRIQTEITGVAENASDEANDEDPVIIPEYFSLKNVFNRLNSYDLSTHPTLGSVVDVMILWSARPSEIMTLQVSPESMATGYSKGENVPRLTITFLPLADAKKYLDWIQKYKEAMPLPTKDGKKYRELLRPFEGLKLKTLRSIGAEYAAYTNTSNPNITNDKELMSLRRIALRHIPQVSSAEFYSVIMHKIPEEYKLPQ